MKIGVFYKYIDENSTQHAQFAQQMLASVRACMPDVEVWHFTDANTPALKGFDCVNRITEDVPMAVCRMMHNASLHGDWMFIDPDIIVQKDVSHVFEDKFDVALTDRVGTITYEADYAKVMPYNLGVSFSRAPAFWKRVLYHLRTLSPKLQQWEGDQLVICEMIKQRVASDFNVKILPGLTYNYPPRSADDPRTADAAIVHYKGPRKAWLQEAA